MTITWRGMMRAVGWPCGALALILVSLWPGMGQAQQDSLAETALTVFDRANRLSDQGDAAGARAALAEFLRLVSAKQAQADARVKAAQDARQACRDANVLQHTELGRITEIREDILDRHAELTSQMKVLGELVRLPRRTINDLIKRIDAGLSNHDPDGQRIALIDVVKELSHSGRLPKNLKIPPSPKKLNDFEKFFADLFGVAEQKIDVRPELHMLRRLLIKMRDDSRHQRSLMWESVGLLGQSNAYLILEARIEEQNKQVKSTLSILSAEARFWKAISRDWAANPTNIPAFLDRVEERANTPLAVEDASSLWTRKRITLRSAITDLSGQLDQHDPVNVEGLACENAKWIADYIDAIGRCQIVAPYPYYRLIDPKNNCKYQLTDPPGCPGEPVATQRLTPDGRKKRADFWYRSAVLTDRNFVSTRRCVDSSMIYFGRLHSEEACAAACEGHTNCRYWTWNRRNIAIPTSTRECWGGPILSKPDLVSTQTGFVSGLSCKMDRFLIPGTC